MLLNRKIDLRNVFLVALALIFSTVLRISLLGIYPLLVLMFLWLFDFRFSKDFFNLIGILLISWLISFRNGFFLKYNLVSLYYYLPLVFLFFARPVAKVYTINPLKILMGALTFFVIINNFFGIIQYFRYPDDDSFVGVYGRFTVTQNGLVLLNTILFFWYLQLYIRSKRQLHLWATFFFIFCTVLGFYGAGLMVLFGAFILFYVKFNFKSLIRLLTAILLLGIIVYFLMDLISPRTLEYNINILKRFWNASIQNAPRKLVIFYNYITSYPRNILDFIFGSGPGTFNSRSAFMVGSPTYFNVNFIKSDVQPYYFNNLAYPLWNPSVITRYDGFMSQPFSSLLAFLGEYGLLLTLLFLLNVRKQYFKTIKAVVLNHKVPSLTFYGKIYKFLAFFVILLLVVDNYFEYPEVIGLLMIIIKLTEQQILSEQMIAG